MEGEAAVVLPVALVGEDIVRAVLVQPVEAVVQRQVGAELGQAAGAVLAAAVLVFPRQQKYDKARMAARRRTEKTAFMCASRWNLCRVFLIVTQHAPKCVIIFEKFQKLMGSLRPFCGREGRYETQIHAKDLVFPAAGFRSGLHAQRLCRPERHQLQPHRADCIRRGGHRGLFLAAEKARQAGKNATSPACRAADGELHGQRLGELPLLCAGVALLLSTEYKRGNGRPAQLQLVGAAEALHLSSC